MDENPYKAPQSREEQPADDPDEVLERFFEIWNMSQRESGD